MSAKRFSATLMSCAAAAGLLAAPIASQAQDTQLPTAEPVADTLGIPADVQVFGQNDPNNRKATAVVNGQVITGTDIDHRMALTLAANENELSAEQLQQLRAQVLRNLIDETLQIQEARAQEIEIDKAQIDQSYQRLAAQNFGQDKEAMDKYLLSVGSSPVSLKRQIEGELAWQQLQRRNIEPFVNVSDGEVSDLLKRMEASRGTNEYRIGEIYLGATEQNRAQVSQNAASIMEQLQQGGSFVAYARQFSEASSAVVGGDLGFVRLGQLPSALSAEVANLQTGQLTGPIETPGGFSILYLIDKRQVLMADPRDALLSLKQISMPLTAGISQEEANAKIEAFNGAIQSIRGCGDASRAAATIGATVVDNNQIRARSLPEQLQQIVLNLQVGQSTPPFGSIEDGVRVLLLCGRDDPEANDGPNPQQMRAQIEEERVAMRAQRYLRDLRNDAYIE